MLEADALPEDLETCQQRLRALTEDHARLLRTHEELLDVCASLQESQRKCEQERDELRLALQRLTRQMYGRRSERWRATAGQGMLDFGADDATLADPAVVSAASEEEFLEYQVRRRPRTPRPRSEQLPAHLERRTMRIEPTLPAGFRLEDCELIGVDVVEVLEFGRASLWVRRYEYPKYKLRGPAATPLDGAAGEARDVAAEQALDAGRALDNPAGGSGAQEESRPQDGPVPPAAVPESVALVAAEVETHGVVQAPRAVTLVPGGRFGFGIAAEVLFDKFVLHVPLYRQQDMWAQFGWSPSRSTLGQIVANSAELLAPLAEFLRQHVLAGDLIGTDDTPVTLLTPGVGEGSRQARFWLYRGRDAAPYNVFAFTDSRAREGPDRFLASFQGTLTGDCYGGYVNIERVSDGRIRFSACLAHARRKVYDARLQQPALGSQILALLGDLYDVEDRARLLTDAARLALRQRESAPAMARLRAVLDSAEAARVLPKSGFGEALHYLREHWAAFQVFLADGRLPIDNNDVERELRRVALGRKNWLFLGSEDAGDRTATILSVVASAHRHDLDVRAYLHDALERLARGGALAPLLPDAWKAAHPEHVRTFRVEEKQARAESRRFRRAQRRAESHP